MKPILAFPLKVLGLPYFLVLLIQDHHRRKHWRQSHQPRLGKRSPQ